MDAFNREAIVNQYITAYNNFDIEAMLKHLHEEVRFINISHGVVDLSLQGIEQFREQAEKAKEIFSRREQKPLQIYPDGDSIEVDIDYTGTLGIDLPNGLKKGDTIALKGKSIFHFEDDRIIKLTDIS